MNIYNWGGLANSTLSDQEIAYINSYLIGNKNFLEFEKAKSWVADLNIKACTGIAKERDIKQLKRIEELEKAFNIICKSSKNEFTQGEEPNFRYDQLCSFLIREYEVSPDDPFIEGLIDDVFAGFRDGTFRDINNKLSIQNFEYVSLSTLEGLSALLLIDMEKNKRAGQESNNLNGGYGLYILMQDFSMLPFELEYFFDPSVGKFQKFNMQNKKEEESVANGDDVCEKSEVSAMNDVDNSDTEEEYDEDAWGPMFNGRSIFSFDDGMDF